MISHTGPLLLAGDIGGTKTTLAVFSAASGSRKPLVETTYSSDDFTRLETMATEFLSDLGKPVEKACFAVAGPVVAGRASVTNLPWVMEEEILQRELGLSAVKLLNDLEGLANAIPLLESTDLFTLNEGRAVEGGAIAAIAPGTGLGETFLTSDGMGYRAHPSEGGHADFAPANAVEDGLLAFLRQRFGHVSAERVASGIGIPNIYDYLASREHHAEAPDLARRLSAAEDRTRIIVEAAMHPDAPSPRCLATMDIFVAALGAEAGNLALKVMATGGVYIGGGIPPRILPMLSEGRFMQPFLQKGRFSQLLDSMPVHVITNTRAPLFGAAQVGLTGL